MNSRGAAQRCGLCVLLLCALTTRLAPAEVVELADLERLAIRGRASLAAQRARRDAAEARIAIAEAPLYPTLSAAASLEALPGSWLIHVQDIQGDEYLVQGTRTLGSSGAFTPQARYGASLSLAARVYDFGRTSSSIAAARTLRAAERESSRAETLRIVSEVRSAYLEWLAAFETRGILSENAGDTRQLRELLEGRVAEGTRPGAALSAARFEEARAALELSRAEAKLTAARLALEHALGQALPADAEPDSKLLTKAPAQQTSSDAARARALHLQSQAASAMARSHRRAKAPVLVASAEAGLRGQSAELFPAYRVGLALSVPLFDGGFSSASASFAEAEAAELAALAREARSGVDAEAAQTRAELLSGEKQLHLAQLMLGAAEDELRHALDQRELGTAPAEAVVLARLRIAQAKLEVLGARVTRARAELHLGGPSSSAR